MGRIATFDLTTVNTAVLVHTFVTEGTYNIRMTNRNAVPIKVKLNIGTGASPVNADFIIFGTDVLVGGGCEDTGKTFSVGEKVWAYTDTAGVSIRIDGIPRT